MLISMWKSPARAPLTSHPSTLLSSLHHLCATELFTRHICPAESCSRVEKISREISSEEARATILSCFLKPLIHNERRRIFLQYHLGGFSRCTLMVCFGSVMSSQRPYVFHPSATTCTKTLPIGAFGTCAMPSRLVFTFISSFLSFLSECSSMNFTYTLAFSMGMFFSPPVTSMVMRVCTSLAGGGAFGLDAGESWAATAWAITAQATMQTHAKNFLGNRINR